MRITRQLHGKRTVQAYVRDTIRDNIFAGELTAGDRLVQAIVARELDVSTTPVREALRELATEGLLQLDPHRGAVVRGMNVEELEEVHELRAVLEPLALRRAMSRMTVDNHAEAARVLAEMEEASSPGEHASLNRRFHHIYLDACGSERLSQMVRSLQDSYTAYTAMTREFGSDRTRQANIEHRQLLDALRDGDVERATEVLLAHIAVPLAEAQHLLCPDERLVEMRENVG